MYSESSDRVANSNEKCVYTGIVYECGDTEYFI